MLELKISGGRIVDGTGASELRGDVGLAGDRIVELGELSAVSARREINATGMIVCPGFVDTHSHSDTYLLIEPSAPSKIFQGITTEVVGNCGASAAPLIGGYQMPSDWADKTYPGAWRSVAEYRALLDRVRPAPNVVLLVGHNNLRAGVVGYDATPPSPAQIREMMRILEECLEQGARGLSTGLVYPPGVFAHPEELSELASVAGRHGGIYTSHMRSEGRDLIESIEETICIGRDSGCRVQVSHLKTAGRTNWRLVETALATIQRARASGIDVAADRYPYISGCTELDVLFPAWAEEGGRARTLERLRTSGDRARLREDLLRARNSEEDWAGITIGSTSHPDNLAYRGTPLLEVAENMGVDPVDAVLRLVELDELKTSAFFFGMSEENMWRILAEPFVMLCTDASLRSPDGPLSHDYPHPRAYGSFPRFLRASIDGNTVGLPEAVRKMTSLPADHFNLTDRGVLKKGAMADITVFDPSRLRDISDYGSPHRLAEGVEHLIVNGVLTITDGRLTGDRAGRFL